MSTARQTPPPSSSLLPGTSQFLSTPRTPLKKDSRTMGQYEPQYQDASATIRQFSYEMSRYFVGPVPPQQFLDDFLPLTSRPPAPNDYVFTQNMFSNLISSASEAAMFNGLVGSIADIIPGLVILNTSYRHDTEAGRKMGADFRPDCLVFTRDVIESHPELMGRADTSRAEFFIEFKAISSRDPFKYTAPSPLSCYPEDELMSPSPTKSYPEDVLMLLREGPASTVLGQMTAYATMILSTQYRTHVFSVLIVKGMARLLRWDRGGAVVTESFPYNDKSYLFDFLFRYNHADLDNRGHDNTVRDSTEQEAQDAQTAIDEWKQEGRLLTVTIQNQPYVIRPPCAQPDIPVGRWTRTSVAYHCETKKRVFFKDSWRVSHPDVTAEGDIYTMLRNSKVTNVPGCLAHGDVGNETYHSTRTHGFVSFTKKPASKSITHYRHYRLVLDTVGRELTSFKSSKELVSAINASLIAHAAAFEAHILHRDISPGNIMIVDNDHNPNIKDGMLIDWDHSKMIRSDSDHACQHARTGTWQFMAAALTEDSTTPHTFKHDLESFFWVLIWAVVSFMPTSFTVEGRSSFLKETMSPKLYINSGGVNKRNYLLARIVPGVDHPHIRILLNYLIRLFAAQYSAISKDPITDQSMASSVHQATGSEPPDTSTGDLDEYFRQNFGYPVMFNFFRTALERQDWPEHDGAKLQSKVPSLEEKHGMLPGSSRSKSHAEETGVLVRSSTT